MKQFLLALLAVVLVAGGCSKRRMTHIGGEDSIAGRSLDKYAREHRLSREEAVDDLQRKRTQAEDDLNDAKASALEKIAAKESILAGDDKPTDQQSSKLRKPADVPKKSGRLTDTPVLEKIRRKDGPLPEGPSKVSLDDASDDPSQPQDPPLPPRLGGSSSLFD